MKTVNQWLSEYEVSHQNSTNIFIHKICVPAIFWSLLGFLYGLQHWVSQLILGALVIGGLLFYAKLGPRVFFGMFAVVLACHASYHLMLIWGLPLSGICAAVFVIAWIGQFYGHNVEGKKPSFFQDLQFLLIGPLWTMKGFFKS
jgi:uncharacterized membrane protein YGL010W